VFRYSYHENTVLRQIRRQMIELSEPLSDHSELIEFIDSITHAKNSNKGDSSGPRNMIDLCDLVQRYYYHPAMGGSYSIKKVLPAVLNASEYLKHRYVKAIYGKGCEIPSLNFSSKAWISVDKNGKVVDPYKALEPILAGVGSIDGNLLVKAEVLKDGGAAATAFARMQFTEMTIQERKALQQALLNYCELDTLAMVMIMEHWLYDITKQTKRAA